MSDDSPPQPEPPPEPELRGPPEPAVRLQPEQQVEPHQAFPPEPEAQPEQEPNFAPQSFRFLTDHNVPDSVGNSLRNLGHDVVRLREVMAVNTPDPVLARAAIEDNRVLVSWDRDFNQQRFMSPRFASLSRLSISGPEMEGAARLEAVFDVVQFALRRAAGAPITIRVGVGRVQIHV